MGSRNLWDGHLARIIATFWSPCRVKPLFKQVSVRRLKYSASAKPLLIPGTSVKVFFSLSLSYQIDHNGVNDANMRYLW